jgi:MoxR-like ATPase
MLFRAGQAAALAAGRDYVLPDDVQWLAPFVLPHRLIMTPKARYSGVSARDIVTEILQRVKVPT